MVSRYVWALSSGGEAGAATERDWSKWGEIFGFLEISWPTLCSNFRFSGAVLVLKDFSVTLLLRFSLLSGFSLLLMASILVKLRDSLVVMFLILGNSGCIFLVSVWSRVLIFGKGCGGGGGFSSRVWKIFNFSSKFSLLLLVLAGFGGGSVDFGTN